MDPPRFAFATLVTSDQYLPGALVTLHSLLDIEPANPLRRDWTTVCLTTPATVGYATLQALTRAFDVVVGVESIVTQSWEELKLLGASLSLAAAHFSRPPHPPDPSRWPRGAPPRRPDRLARTPVSPAHTSP